jgi:hypothetical protein
MSAPLRSTHVLFTPEQLAFLRLAAAKRHTTMSFVLRELVDKERQRQKIAERREAGGQ